MTPTQAAEYLAAKRTDEMQPYALNVTVHNTGMRLIRQRGTHCSQPEFIAAYLATEEAKYRSESFAFVERFVTQLMAAEEHSIQHAKEIRDAH